MTINAILDAIKNVKNGTFVSVEYETIPTILASARNAGIVITKRTRKVARLGVNYSHIARVIAGRIVSEQSGAVRANPYEWSVANTVAKNVNNDNMYLHITNVPNGSHTKSRWFLNGKEVAFENVVEYLTPSYLRKGTEMPLIQKINLDNVIKIGK